MGSCASKNASRAPWKFPGFPTFFVLSLFFFLALIFAGTVDFSEDGIVRALRSWRVYAGSGYAVFDFEFDQNKGTLSFSLLHTSPLPCVSPSSFFSPPHLTIVSLFQATYPAPFTSKNYTAEAAISYVRSYISCFVIPAPHSYSLQGAACDQFPPLMAWPIAVDGGAGALALAGATSRAGERNQRISTHIFRIMIPTAYPLTSAPADLQSVCVSSFFIITIA